MINWLLFLLILGHLIFSTISNIGFKISAHQRAARRFVAWQAVGHLSGFTSVLIYTALLTHLPVSVAFPITQGLSVLGVQWVAARLLFKERIVPLQWLGTGLIIGGIFLLSA